MSARIALRLRHAALAALLAGATPFPAQAQYASPSFVNPMPGDNLTGALQGANVAAPTLRGAIAAPIQGRSTPPFPSSIEGRWSASTACVRSATQLVLTNNAMELVGRGGRLYYANIAYVQEGTDRGVLVTSAPNVNQMGSAGAQLGDAYVFRVDSATRITPVAIVRANARRDRVGSNWPAFFRCR
jgi:hypothetical protein